MTPQEQLPTFQLHNTPSEDFCLLAEQFKHIEPPYTAEDVRSFSRVYRRIYRDLSSDDRLEAEHMVDLLIAGLENPKLASLIFGVV